MHVYRKAVSVCLMLLCGDIAGIAQSACYSSPAAAMDALGEGSSVQPASGGGGYRILNLRTDPLLGQRWVTIQSCEHPERPATAFLLKWSPYSTHGGLGGVDSAHRTAAVHAGETVHLWRQERYVRIEASGVAEESGAAGETIRVRLLRAGADDSSAKTELAGIVRGPFDVEMEP